LEQDRQGLSTFKTYSLKNLLERNLVSNGPLLAM
jgi:hypothetical protein